MSDMDFVYSKIHQIFNMQKWTLSVTLDFIIEIVLGCSPFFLDYKTRSETIWKFFRTFDCFIREPLITGN